MQSLRLSIIITLLGILLSACGEAVSPEAAPKINSNQKPTEPTTSKAQSDTVAEAVDSVAKGEKLFQSHRCWFCHNVTDAPPKLGPNLTRVGATLKKPALVTWIKNPKAITPDTKMPDFVGTPAELDQLVDYMISLK